MIRETSFSFFLIFFLALVHNIFTNKKINSITQTRLTLNKWLQSKASLLISSPKSQFLQTQNQYKALAKKEWTPKEPNNHNSQQHLNTIKTTHHLYLTKQHPSMRVDSGTSSGKTDPSGRRSSTYGVSSHPTIGMSDGRCTRSTLSMLPGPAFPHHTQTLTLTVTPPKQPPNAQPVADPPSPALKTRQPWSDRPNPKQSKLETL